MNHNNSNNNDNNNGFDKTNQISYVTSNTHIKRKRHQSINRAKKRYNKQTSYKSNKSSDKSYRHYKKCSDSFEIIRREINEDKLIIDLNVPFLSKTIEDTNFFVNKHSEIKEIVRTKIDIIESIISNCYKCKSLLTKIFYCEFQSKNFKRLNERLIFNIETILSEFSELDKWSVQIKTMCPSAHHPKFSCGLCVTPYITIEEKLKSMLNRRLQMSKETSVSANTDVINGRGEASVISTLRK